MNSTIKVVKKDIMGWFSADFDENQIAQEIESQEAEGWQLVSSYGMRLCASLQGAATDTLVFIYRKK